MGLFSWAFAKASCLNDNRNMSHTNVDPAELAKFSELAHRWWDPESEFRPLHQINPLRLGWIDGLVGLGGKRVVDVGCGGGILADAMARKGAQVLGIDLATKSLKVAQLHALEAGTAGVQYREVSAEALAAEQPTQFDAVTCMEMLEHVPDPAAVVQACAATPGVSIVPQGGNTGLVVGSVPDDSGTQVVLSLTRMNAVRALDPDNLTMTVEAGCVLQNLQDEAERAGFLFPLSLAAEGSCTIGGNLGTNAGGTQVLRFGNARDLCLGLEVVTPAGEVVWEYIIPWFAPYPDEAARKTGGGMLNSVFQTFRYQADQLPWLKK